jgi:hypothetical protein
VASIYAVAVAALSARRGGVWDSMKRWAACLNRVQQQQRNNNNNNNINDNNSNNNSSRGGGTPVPMHILIT